MWEILFFNPFTREWEHSMFTKSKDAVARLIRIGKRAVSIA